MTKNIIKEVSCTGSAALPLAALPLVRLAAMPLDKRQCRCALYSGTAATRVHLYAALPPYIFVQAIHTKQTINARNLSDLAVDFP